MRATVGVGAHEARSGWGVVSSTFSSRAMRNDVGDPATHGLVDDPLGHHPNGQERAHP